MSYSKRVVKRRSACLTDEEWLSVVERGKLPRPDFRNRDGQANPPADVRDLVDLAVLDGLHWRLRILWMAMVEPNVAKKGSGTSSSSARVGELLAQFSELWEFLSGSTYASGKPRLTGHLSLRCEQEGVKVTLTDPSTHSYCTRTGESLDDVLLALEVALKEGSLKWLPSSFSSGKK